VLPVLSWQPRLAGLNLRIRSRPGDCTGGLVTLADGMITFRWRDSAHHNKKRLMTLPANEILRRYLLHVLPPGFVRIRYFSLMAHRRRRGAPALLATAGPIKSVSRR